MLWDAKQSRRVSDLEISSGQGNILVQILKDISTFQHNQIFVTSRQSTDQVLTHEWERKGIAVIAKVSSFKGMSETRSNNNNFNPPKYYITMPQFIRACVTEATHFVTPISMLRVSMSEAAKIEGDLG